MPRKKKTGRIKESSKKNKKQIKFLKKIIENLVGKQGAPLVDLLAGKKDVNEFNIAKKLNLTINQTRNILYRLSDYGLVSFMRKKDKRKGWYIYFWTLNIYQAFDVLEKKLNEELQGLENELNNRKENRFYFCNTCSIEVSEETALLNDFTCPECGEVYQLADNTKIINELEKKIAKIKEEINLVRDEKEKEKEKSEKKKKRKIEKESKIKKNVKKRKKSKSKKEKKKKKK